ncbi:hypothetical protein F3I54_13725 [Pantoea sp. VH_18]|uniref:hypothetical protein n=1 Tax=unclassified Pantoea TaxID=2630326 RepID=UPI00123271FD|nr:MULTISPECIES: hypothetical protein [unclassified Pantoea]KAA5955376.1 hypothetical protein F3I55_12365 [Pantoea sp. VH_24]KAA5964201.1 hypothetical protein F3I54_13725 [Pantoea sp. VH_18]KAA5995320.1 hypothetical protein F3I46_16950 [Pantoea sp. M_1]KAA5997787.1 hypothetical protein F3I45_19930 [Pantoea sp. F_7]KAA6006030.1 hypothetical protein F3I43_19930 [Pantoea sp. F_18]
MIDYRNCVPVIKINNGMLVMKILTNVMTRIHRWEVFAEVRGMSGQKYVMEWNGMEWNGMEWNGMEWIL